MDSKESIPPSYVAWRAGETTLNPNPTRFLAPIDCSKIPAQFRRVPIWRQIFYFKRGFVFFFCTLFKTALSAGPQIPLCRRMLGSKTAGLLRLRHCQSDALTSPRLYLIHFGQLTISQ